MSKMRIPECSTCQPPTLYSPKNSTTWIGRYKIRIEQQRIHAKESSGDPSQQKHARAQLTWHYRRPREAAGPAKSFRPKSIPQSEATSALRTAPSGGKG
jgi:hypothetical protein